MPFCLKKVQKNWNSPYRYIQKDIITDKPTASFNKGIFLDVRNSFFNENTRFINILKITKGGELQKNTCRHMAPVGWVIAEKIRPYKLFFNSGCDFLYP